MDCLQKEECRIIFNVRCDPDEKSVNNIQEFVKKIDKKSNPVKVSRKNFIE